MLDMDDSTNNLLLTTATQAGLLHGAILKRCEDYITAALAQQLHYELLHRNTGTTTIEAHIGNFNYKEMNATKMVFKGQCIRNRQFVRDLMKIKLRECTAYTRKCKYNLSHTIIFAKIYFSHASVKNLITSI